MIDKPAIKLVAVMEASTVTGPAKNLIEFCRRARVPDQKFPGLPIVETSIVTFHRGAGAFAPGESVWRCDAHAAMPSEAPNKFVAAVCEAGIEVEVIAERFRFDRRVIAVLRKILARRAPDIVQTHNLKSHFLMKVSGLWREYPWIAFHHGYTTTDLRMRAYNQLDRWSLPSAGRVVTVCHAFARQLAQTGVPLERISVQHNSISAGQPISTEDEVSALRLQLGVEDNVQLLLAVGRLSQEKGHVELIYALDYLRRIDSGIDFKLIIVGDGPERPRVERMIASLGLAEQVIFAGHTNNVRPYYALADLFVLPSHSEGSPNVLLEAMAAGIPIAATTVGGVPEIVEDGESALLVTPRDPQALATAINRLLTDAELACKLTAKASERVATRYSRDAHIRSLLEIYRDFTLNTATKNASG
ncbi:MAG: glycosyltransferase [Pyrinomonadaceae bacterium]